MAAGESFSSRFLAQPEGAPEAGNPTAGSPAPADPAAPATPSADKYVAPAGALEDEGHLPPDRPTAKAYRASKIPAVPALPDGARCRLCPRRCRTCFCAPAGFYSDDLAQCGAGPSIWRCKFGDVNLGHQDVDAIYSSGHSCSGTMVCGRRVDL